MQDLSKEQLQFAHREKTLLFTLQGSLRWGTLRTQSIEILLTLS